MNIRNIQLPEYIRKPSRRAVVMLFVFLILCICILTGVLVFPALEYSVFRNRMEKISIPGVKLKNITRDTAEFLFGEEGEENIFCFDRKKKHVTGSDVNLKFPADIAAICKAWKGQKISGSLEDAVILLFGKVEWNPETVNFTVADGVLSGTVPCVDSECGPGTFRYDSNTGLLSFANIHHHSVNLIGFHGEYHTEYFSTIQAELAIPPGQNKFSWDFVRKGSLKYSAKECLIAEGYKLYDVSIDETYDAEQQKIRGTLEGRLNKGKVAGTAELDVRTGVSRFLLKGTDPEMEFDDPFIPDENYSIQSLSIQTKTDQTGTIRDLAGTDYHFGRDLRASAVRKKETGPVTEQILTNSVMEKDNFRLTASEMVFVDNWAEPAPGDFPGRLKSAKDISVEIPSAKLRMDGGTLDGGKFKFKSVVWDDCFSGSAEVTGKDDGSFSGTVSSPELGKGTFSGSELPGILDMPSFDWKNLSRLLPCGMNMTGKGSMMLRDSLRHFTGTDCTLSKGDFLAMTGVSFKITLRETGITERTVYPWVTEPGQNISFSTMKIGDFTFSNGKIRFRRNESSVVLESAEAEWCGGKIRITPGTVLPEEQFIADCEGLDLAQFLTQIGVGKFSGTGKISGRLPFTLTKDGEIKPGQGTLFSIPGEDGTLKGSLQNTLMTGQGADGLRFAFEMMEDMKYRWVKIAVMSGADGQTLRLGIRFNASPGREMMYEPDLVNGGIRKSDEPTRLGYLLLNLDEITLKPDFLHKFSGLLSCQDGCIFCTAEMQREKTKIQSVKPE